MQMDEQIKERVKVSIDKSDEAFVKEDYRAAAIASLSAVMWTTRWLNQLEQLHELHLKAMCLN